MNSALIFSLQILGIVTYGSALKCYSCDSRSGIAAAGCGDAAFNPAGMAQSECAGSCRFSAVKKPAKDEIDYTTRSCDSTPTEETSCSVNAGGRQNSYVDSTECQCLTDLCNDASVAVNA